MKVEQIIQAKGADVYAVFESDKISDAVKLLNEKNIGAVIVKNASGLISGILSERDIVRRLGEKGGDALNMPVGDCMTPDPISCSPDSTIEELMEQMTTRRIRHLPVLNSGSLVGVVSIGDVVKRKIELAEQEAQALKDYIAS